MTFSLTGTLLALWMLLPSLVCYKVFPPARVPEGLPMPPLLFTLMERVGQILCLSLLIISGKGLSFSRGTVWMVCALCCAAAYSGLWVRYLMGGCAFHLLYRKWWVLPIPMAIFQTLTFVFTALWGGSWWLGVATAVFAVGHGGVSWHTYRQVCA